jgi:galactonate dehydratase
MNPARRAALRAIASSGTAALLAGAPAVVRSQAPLSLGCRTISDPDGWHASLRLKGDWLVFEISDGVHAGFGEASHSRDDAACCRRAGELFSDFYTGFSLSMENLRAKEAEIATLEPDFVTATAFSGINQALYDLLAKRERVPVWRLFTDRTSLESVPLYTTINRALAERTHEEYLDLVGALVEQGFQTFKCAPFEQVDSVENAIAKSRAGFETLAILRDAFPDVRMRVDFHERFRPGDFYELLPELEVLGLDWIEEPFSMGPDYTELRARTDLTVAGGELFWGDRRFGEIADLAWVDVIMPDVKHVGGFGPLLRVFELAEDRVSVSPHNPSGPISTAASLHAAALFPERVDAIEYAFDRAGSRSGTGERVSRGRLYLPNRPGWGVAPA